ncbi:MAG: DUF4149 domain-containing protein [Halieaceae bacterium]|jgi:hypothetical protein|nr:DUF4149 domain-containing protein [Halieaceae bacterium]
MTLQSAAALIFAALLFGGMVLYSFGFAAFLFTSLPADEAGTLLRRAFPHFYTWVVGTAIVAALLQIGDDPTSLYLLLAVALTTLPARQLLMPAINAATDAGDKRRFNRLHGFSVLVTLAHIAAVAYVLLRFLA